MRTALLAIAFACGLGAQTASAQDTTAGAPYKTFQQIQQLAAKLRTQWAARVAAGLAPATVTEPSLTAGKILTPTVDVSKAPGVAAAQLTVDAGTVGIAYVGVGTTDPTGQRNFQNAGTAALPPFLPQPQSNTIDMQIAFGFGGLSGNLYVTPGTYRIYIAFVVSRDGTTIFYQGNQLTSLFNQVTYTVTNPGTPDTAPPKVGRGAILTPVISLSKPSPYFAARLTVADTLSGVSLASLGISNGGGTTYFPQSNFSYPSRRGTADIVLDASPFTVGTYTITSVTVCDVASNCLYKTAPADIQAIFPKTTFQVTQ